MMTDYTGQKNIVYQWRVRPTSSTTPGLGVNGKLKDETTHRNSQALSIFVHLNRPVWFRIEVRFIRLYACETWSHRTTVIQTRVLLLWWLRLWNVKWPQHVSNTDCTTIALILSNWAGLFSFVSYSCATPNTNVCHKARSKSRAMPRLEVSSWWLN